MQEITNIKIYMRCLDNKKFRQIMCENFINENPIISNAIIENWDLKRIDLKYRAKTRCYDENSYSKQKIKEEEIIFQKKLSLYQPLRYYFEEQRILNDKLFVGLEAHENHVVDDAFYKQMILGEFIKFDFPESPLVVKKNNRHRIGLTNRILYIAEVRKVCIEEYIVDYRDLLMYIIDEFNLKFLRYKYINKTISKYESSYTRQKIKLEELFLINKVYQYSVWYRRINVFHDLEKNLLNENIIAEENESIYNNCEFLELFVASIIAEFRDVNFDIADDININ